MKKPTTNSLADDLRAELATWDLEAVEREGIVRALTSAEDPTDDASTAGALMLHALRVAPADVDGSGRKVSGSVIIEDVIEHVARDGLAKALRVVAMASK